MCIRDRTGALAGTVAVRAGPDAPAGQPAPGLPDPVDPDAVRVPVRSAAAVPVPAAGLRTARAGLPDPGIPDAVGVDLPAPRAGPTDPTAGRGRWRTGTRSRPSPGSATRPARESARARRRRVC